MHGAEPSAAAWSVASSRAIRKNDGHLSPWQEAVGHEIIPDTHKNACANEATTGLTLRLFVMLFQDVVIG